MHEIRTIKGAAAAAWISNYYLSNSVQLNTTQVTHRDIGFSDFVHRPDFS
jgi:hypothetical protein